MSRKIGFIGAGNMAGAIIEAILNKKITDCLAVCDKISDKKEKYKNLGINVFDNIKELAEFSDIIILAVKPQDYETILNDLKNCPVENKIIVSIAAGISTDYVKKFLGKDSKVVRVMPNTPLLIGEGASALCYGEPVTEDEFNEVKAIFEAGGVVAVLPEEKMNAVISVNGSSPAYIYLFAKAAIDGAYEQGIDKETAKLLFCKTLTGAAEMLLQSESTPEQLISAVASPGGTTLKALEVFYQLNFEEIIKEAMKKCTGRAEELGR